MSRILEARQAVAATVNAAGVTAHPNFPDRLTPPCVAVQAGDPYLDSGQVYGTYLARHELLMVEQKAANTTAADRIDDRLDTVLTALIAAGYGIERVSQPYGLDVGTAVYPTVSITTTSEITI